MHPAARFGARAGARSGAAFAAKLAVVLALAVAAVATPAARAAVAAGTSIDSTAAATFVGILDRNAAPANATSNRVHAVVSGSVAATVTPGTVSIGATDGPFTIPLRITNTGNLAGSYSLDVAAAGGLALQGVGAVLDANGNGVVDASDPILTSGASFVLAPGAAATVLLIGIVPSGTVPGTIAGLTLTVRGPDGAPVARSGVTVVAQGPAPVSVTNSASRSEAKQGDIFDFTVVGRSSELTLPGSPVTVDGVATSLVLVRSPTSVGMVVITGTPQNGALLLYHHRGDPDDVFSRTLGVRVNVDAVAFGVPTLGAGQAITGSVTSFISPTASGSIVNTATMTFTDQGAVRTVPSNTIGFGLPALQPSIGIFSTKNYLYPIPSFDVGTQLYVQFIAPACSGDTTHAITHTVRLDAKLSGDSAMMNVTETAPLSGVFLSEAPVKTIGTLVPGTGHADGFLAVMKDDKVFATTVSCAAGTFTSSLVDPAGVVFDPKTNLPVAGATVTLIDVSGRGNEGKPGEAAVVYDYDGETQAPSTVTSGTDGTYHFPLVASSTYRLVVKPPAGYSGPSRVAASALPAGRTIDASGSYGGNFVVADVLVTIDYPLDAVPVDGLFVEKTASKAIAEIGDFVDYKVTVRNASTAALPSIVVHDRLPRGFALQKGTVRVDGAKAADPTGSSTVDFAIGTVQPQKSVVLSYRLRIGPGAQGGDGVNRATATSGPTRSNEASAKVELSDGGVLSNRAYLIGKVFADCNGNRVQDAGERGIPEVRIVLEDGTYAITDEDGKYSLYGLLPRTHVAKVDATTLVEGTSLEVLDNRNAGDPASRFVDLRNGELHRADFAVTGCGPALDAAIAARRERASRLEEIEGAARVMLNQAPAATLDRRTLPSSGIIDARGMSPRASAANTSAANASPMAPRNTDAASVVAPGTTAPAAAPALSTRMETLDPALGFVDLVDGATMSSTQATIRTKGPAAGRRSLFVDGKRVDDTHVGERSVVADRNVAAVEYVGVSLAPGRNRLELVAEDDFGNARERVAIVVRVAGSLAAIAVDAPAEIAADGRSLTKLKLRLVDADGLPVAGRLAATLDVTAGRLLVTDVDPREPGVQVIVDGGTLDIDLQAPGEPGRATLRVAVGTLKADVPLVFVADLRPLMAVGVVEGVLNLRNLGSNAITGAQSGDAFEREIRNVSRSFDGGKGSADARAALYLKGKVLGSTLLTLAYDSDKPQRERLFRDIQPDQFYPVYGDSSVKGFDAQSTSRLYVRVDQGQSFALYGDFTTQTDDPARTLTRYDRALTGANGRVEEGPLRVDGFAAYTSSRQVVDELRGNGTSGPFTLSRQNAVVNSEQVHVLTRDRNQPAIVVRDVPLTRFSDYEIEPFTGRILFKMPIPSVDADLNPVSIRIAYEVDDGGPKFWVGGVDAKLAVTDSATLGGVYIRDTDPSDRSTLRGVNGTVRLSDHSFVVGEFAETDSDLRGLGRGRRVEYKHDEPGLEARIYGAKTDVSFVNPNALLSQGRTEYGAKVALRLSEQDRLLVDGIRTEDPLTGGRRTGALARIERTFASGIKLEVGVRRVDETAAPAQNVDLGTVPESFTSVRAKLTVPVPYVADANAFVEYERALGGGDKQVAAVGGNYALPQGGKLYVRHEFISSLAGAYDLNSTQRLTTTVIGVDSDYMKDGHLFNEYRVGGGIDARSSEAAIGLRNLWRVADGVGITTTAENIRPIGGPVNDRSTALTGAVDYTASPDWKGSARAEYRNASTAGSWLMTTGAAYKLDDNTTLLGKAVYSNIDAASATSGGRRVMRGQLGVAYRPVDSNVWNALARVEIKREVDGTNVDAPLDETAAIASMHLNVSPTPDLGFNARYAIKRTIDRSNGIVSRGITQLLGGRAIKDVTDKWDVGVNAFVLATDGLRSRSFALGGEVGYRVATNLWVSAGYNVSGFKDRDLAGEEYTQRGAYLRMRYKFDESLFGALSKGGRS